jgi:hypothetical protein
MRKAQHIAIVSRLEATKQHGLLRDYDIRWDAGRFAKPRIIISAIDHRPEQMTRNYITQLLATLVPSRAIEMARGQKAA